MQKLNRTRSILIPKVIYSLSVILLSGCLPTPSEPNSRSANPSALTVSAATLPNGPRAVKIIFKQAVDGGSFATASSSGTLNAAGSGVQITQVFKPDGTSLSTSPTSSSWPAWLSSVEVGTSGTTNTNASHPDCARFATVAQDGAAQCKFKYPSPDLSNCGAPSGYYRVSDYDCNNHINATARGIGSGISTDGVYIRANFNRSSSALGPNENILAVLEYSASSIHPAPANPSSCFSGGSSSIESCTDHTWRVFLKHSASEALQSFLLLVPPSFASVYAGSVTTGNSGSGISTKQFVLPLASDAALSVLQISRTGLSSDLAVDPTFAAICAPQGGSGNSAFCVGMVFYSLTLYRI